MKTMFDIINEDGESYATCTDEGSWFMGFDTYADAEYQLKCMEALDREYNIPSQWHIVEFDYGF